MILKPTAIAGAVALAIEPANDERGHFARTFCVETLRSAGLACGPLRQTSLSYNTRRGTLRGLHWQCAPASENKIISVIAGKVFDVVVDVRPHSRTYRQWFGLELDATAHNALFVPSGCAHGFLTLTDNSVVSYGMDADFAPQQARGARWNDAAFAITWPFDPAVISERDRNWPDFTP